MHECRKLRRTFRLKYQTFTWVVEAQKHQKSANDIRAQFLWATDISNQKEKHYLSHSVTKPTMWLCAKRRLGSAWASAQSDQSLRCALNG